MTWERRSDEPSDPGDGGVLPVGDACRAAAVARLSGCLAHHAPGRSLVDELLAERRAEVAAERQEDLAARDRLNGPVAASPVDPLAWVR